ncbi:MAG: hypothetical protein AMS23_00565 [Bacteroides sp. SM1_62]|nr:MAG: hypothetical protein AMS26_00535 [Bacteroides sp. SM23_62]KPL26703.1 MAG: hypothetical protein AMS23_00565 [Bacteroides sp. SM1_62]
MDYKKQMEFFIVNLFQEHYPDFPKGLLKPSESPDFILGITPRQKIGIEITSLHPYFSDTDLLSYENITACLKAKNEKLSLYRKKKLDEYWLIISVNDLHSWNRINVNNKLIVWNFKTGFNRVFLFNTIYGKVLELNHE